MKLHSIAKMSLCHLLHHFFLNLGSDIDIKYILCNSEFFTSVVAMRLWSYDTGGFAKRVCHS